MGKQYSHLSSEERALLQIERGNGASTRSIARRLSRSASTLSRELVRQHGSVYAASVAAENYRRRRRACARRRKLVEGSVFFQEIGDDLVLYRWSGRPSRLLELMKRLNIDIWFADPHAPWQRGSAEAMIIPTACCASSCRRAQTCPRQARRTSTTWLT